MQSAGRTWDEGRRGWRRLEGRGHVGRLRLQQQGNEARQVRSEGDTQRRTSRAEEGKKPPCNATCMPRNQSSTEPQDPTPKPGLPRRPGLATLAAVLESRPQHSAARLTVAAPLPPQRRPAAPRPLPHFSAHRPASRPPHPPLLPAANSRLGWPRRNRQLAAPPHLDLQLASRWQSPSQTGQTQPRWRALPPARCLPPPAAHRCCCCAALRRLRRRLLPLPGC